MMESLVTRDKKLPYLFEGGDNNDGSWIILPFFPRPTFFFPSYSFTKLVKKPSQGMGFGGRIVLPKSSFAAAERILYRKEGEKIEERSRTS